MTDWIHSFTGRKVYPLIPTPDMICIEDIAHALSMQCRFTGHTKFFWSVAQHSLLVMSLCDRQDALWGLLHDASEAYIADVSSPLKHQPAFTAYREAEAQMMQVICQTFGLSEEMPASVHWADREALSIEAHQLMRDVSEWGLPTPKRIPLRVRPREMVEESFLANFQTLTLDRRVAV